MVNTLSKLSNLATMSTMSSPSFSPRSDRERHEGLMEMIRVALLGTVRADSEELEDDIDARAGDFHRSPTRSTASIFGFGPFSPRSPPPSPRSRRQPGIFTPVVRRLGPWLRAAASPRRRRQSPIKPSSPPEHIPFHYRRAPSVPSPCRMPTTSPDPLVLSPATKYARFVETWSTAVPKPVFCKGIPVRHRIVNQHINY